MGATTRLGALPEPFRARFRLKERPEPYDEEELAEIVGRAAGRLGAPVTFEAAREVARRSGGDRRDAIRCLERARDVAQVVAAAETARMRQVSLGSEDAPLSQVTVDREVKLAHVGQNTMLSSDATRSQIRGPAKSQKRAASTYEKDEAGSLQDSAPESAVKIDAPAATFLAQDAGESDAPAARGDTTPSSIPQSEAAVSAVAEASGTSQASPASEDAPLSQVTLDREVKLAHVGQDTRLSPDATRSQIRGPAKPQKRAASTYGNGQAPSGAPVVGAALIVMAAHVIEAACRAGIDKHGLAREERGIVGLLLERGKPTGLEAIASRLDLNVETLRDVHEPVPRATRPRGAHGAGRAATEKTRALYG